MAYNKSKDIITFFSEEVKGKVRSRLVPLERYFATYVAINVHVNEMSALNDNRI